MGRAAKPAAAVEVPSRRPRGQRALGAVHCAHFGRVLMDIQVPELDGIEATAEIRRNEAPGHHIPIIALTAHAMEGDAERFRSAGRDAHLAKPFEIHELTALIDELVRGRPLSPA